MLISYKVKNFCSFSEIAEFKMTAPYSKVKKRFADNYVCTDTGFDILKTAVIVGENAGGKTNFINSLEFFKSLFVDNKTKHTYKQMININNYMSDKAEEDRTKQYFSVQIIAKDNLIYDYVIEIDRFSIVREELKVTDKKGRKPQIILSASRQKIRPVEDDKRLELEYSLQLAETDKKEKEILEKSKLGLENSIGLFVTRLAILGNQYAQNFINWVNNELYVESKRINYDVYKSIQREEDDIRILNDMRFLEIMKLVDNSICKIEVDEEKPYSKSRIIRKMENGQDFIRELKLDSSGVSEFFAWAVQLFRVVYENKTVVADEMDKVINPILADRVIAFINGKNHKGQFIFSTHNVLHLDLKTYMKEQIYFISKRKDNLNSELYSLADFPEIRYETTKIYEFYMKGILGGTAFE